MDQIRYIRMAVVWLAIYGLITAIASACLIYRLIIVLKYSRASGAIAWAKNISLILAVAVSVTVIVQKLQAAATACQCSLGSSTYLTLDFMQKQKFSQKRYIP